MKPLDDYESPAAVISRKHLAELAYINRIEQKLAARNDEIELLRRLLGTFATDSTAGYISDDDEDYCQYCFERSVHRLYETPLYPHTGDCLVTRARTALEQAASEPH